MYAAILEAVLSVQHQIPACSKATIARTQFERQLLPKAASPSGVVIFSGEEISAVAPLVVPVVEVGGWQRAPVLAYLEWILNSAFSPALLFVHHSI